MDCKRIQELLPLYVGCDLNERLENSIGAHLQFCTTCANSVDEFRETRQLVRQYESPALSDDFYASLRQEVIDKITHEPEAQGKDLFATGLFRPRLSWALVTALLFALCVLTFYVSSLRTEEHQQLANDSRAVNRIVPNASRDASMPEKGRIKALSSNTINERIRQGVSNGRNNASVITRSVNRMREQPSREVGSNHLASRVHDQGAAAGQATINEGLIMKPDGATAGNPSSSQKMMRMEIQTKDKNIRIIWFSQRDKKQESSSESYQGT